MHFNEDRSRDTRGRATGATAKVSSTSVAPLIALALALISATDAEPFGASLMLGLLPGGNVLTERVSIQLSVMRGSRTILTHAGTLG